MQRQQLQGGTEGGSLQRIGGPLALERGWVEGAGAGTHEMLEAQMETCEDLGILWDVNVNVNVNANIEMDREDHGGWEWCATDPLLE